MQQDDKKTLKVFAKRVKKLRENKSKSLNSFAFERGLITSATLSRVENALVDLKFTTLVKLSQTLDISLSELLEGVIFEEYED